MTGEAYGHASSNPMNARRVVVQSGATDGQRRLLMATATIDRRASDAIRRALVPSGACQRLRVLRRAAPLLLFRADNIVVTLWVLVFGAEATSMLG